MFETIVAERAERARAAGKAYLAVCFDTFDRLRGDDDLGYYYPAFDDAAALLAFLADKQTGTWKPENGRDFCEAIIALCEPDRMIDPEAWLKAQPR